METIKLNHPKFTAFYANNPDFDILTFDFFKSSDVASLCLDNHEGLLNELQAYQRLLRIYPNEQIASSLLEQGYDSAHKITVAPLHKFLRNIDHSRGGLDSEILTEVYASSKKRVNAAKHLFANIHNTVGSSHYMSMLPNNVGEDITSYVEGIPSYEDFFGTLNYVGSEHCESIFSPSAYFLDMMRITDDYITDPNTHKASDNIPAGYALSERRPDLFEIDLTCENTSSLIPYLRIVNEILERRIENELVLTKDLAKTATDTTITLATSASPDNDAYNGAILKITDGLGVHQIQTIIDYDGTTKVATLKNKWSIIPDKTSTYEISSSVYQKLATATYPFNLPFNLPLAKLRLFLQNEGTTLTSIYKNFAAPVTGDNVSAATASDITLVSTASSKNNEYATMQIEIVSGKGMGQIRVIESYDGTSKIATLNKDWKVIPDKTAQYCIYDSISQDREYLGLSIEQYKDLITPNSTESSVAPFYGLSTIVLKDISKVASFLERTGLTWEQLSELLTQGLSASEVKDKVANQFYINSTGESLDPMEITEDKTDPNNPVYTISNVSIKRLDRLSKFIRLSQYLEWTYSDLEYALKSLSDGKSNYILKKSTIKNLAGIQLLKAQSNLPITSLCSFWYQIKTYGKGNGAVPTDPFDQIFNDPHLLDGQDPYTSTDIIPFDPTRPLTWQVSDVDGINGVIASRLAAALQLGSNDLVELGNYVLQLLGIKTGKLPLDLTGLSWLYKISIAASSFKLSINEYLVLINMMYSTDSYHNLSPSDLSKFTVQDIINQWTRAEWFKKTPFTIYEALYILEGIETPFYTAAYQTSEVAPLIENLSTAADASRFTRTTFVLGDIDEQVSEEIFNKLQTNNFITDYGISLNNVSSFTKASKKYPFTDSDFITKDISASESKVVYDNLQKSHPNILEKTSAKTSILTTSYSNDLPLSFLFIGDDNANNKRNQVRSILTSRLHKILTTEYAFLFTVNNSSFVNDTIDEDISKLIFSALESHKPKGSNDPILVSNGANSATLNADFNQNTDLSFLFKSKGAGQSIAIKSYDGTTKIATLDSNWKSPIPDSTSQYQIIQLSNSGIAQSGSQDTITLDKSASAKKGAYVGMTITISKGTGKGQERIITGYTKTTKIATVNLAWDTIPDTTSNYEVSLIKTQGTAVSGSTNTLQLDANASSKNDAYKGFLLKIIEDKDAILKQNMVKNVLLNTQSNIESVVNKISSLQLQQRTYVRNGLADFLKTSPEILTAILPFTGQNSQIADILQAFLTPISKGQVSKDTYTLIRSASQYIVLFDTLHFSISEVNAVLDMPQVFGFYNGTLKVSFDTLETLSKFKSLVSDFNDTDDGLISYFRLPNDLGKDSAKINALSQLTLWPASQIVTLIDRFWNTSNWKSTINNNTVTGIFHLNKCFSNSKTIKLNIDGLLQLYALGSLPITKNGQISETNWQYYQNQASIVEGAMGAGMSSTEFKEASEENDSKLNVGKRNALMGYAIWLLNAKFPQIESPSDLFQYLLIDVEMSGCDNISRIAQGIGSIQLYMQRCRMMLEPGVTELSNIPEVWWSWMSSYRIWEANRKIFLYPENYIDPVLRRNQTPEFKKFSDSLLQTNIDNESVSSAYQNYFSDLNHLAGLINCASYTCKVPVSGSNKTLDTLFVFGRTNKQPATFYYRKFDNQYAWSPWKKIDITINSMIISPVYSFNKLFIFWAETELVEGSTVDKSDSIPIQSVSTKVMFSFLNEKEEWSQPQVLRENAVVNYKENYQYDPYIRSALPFVQEFFNSDLPFWQSVYPLHVPADSITDKTAYPNGENIFISYGFSLKSSVGSPLSPVAEPSSEMPANKYQLEDAIYNLLNRYNSQVKELSGDMSTYVPMIKSTNMDINLKSNDLYTSFVSYVPKSFPTPYIPLLRRDQNSFGINQAGKSSIIINNYYTDNYSQHPSPYLMGGGRPPGLELLKNISGEASTIVNVKNKVGSYIFDNGDETFLVVSQEEGIGYISESLSASKSYPPFPSSDFYFVNSAYTTTPTSFNNLKFKFTRLSTNVINTLNSKLIIGGIDNMLTIDSQQTPELSFSRLTPTTSAIAPSTDVLDFNGSYGLYFWETFFHGPLLVAGSLNQNKKYSEAQKWYEYIFNPTEPNTSGGSDIDRFWQFLPFRSMNIPSLTEILTNKAQIFAYNNDPFDPDAIARLRISAYAKTTVMKYIDNILDWGDFLFQQDTRESITQATNLYVLASDLLGKRPIQTGTFSPPQPMSFNDIKAEYNDKTVLTGTATAAGTSTLTLAANASSEKDAYVGMYVSITGGTGKGSEKYYIVAYDAKKKEITIEHSWQTKPDNTSTYRIFVNGIPEFLIRLENSGIIKQSEDAKELAYADGAFNNIDSYFSIPENQEFIAYWDRVEDRLYKIRHCMNFQGQVRTLALFAPPIDPRALIRAAGSSSGLPTLMNSAYAMPNYRFKVLIEKAKSLTTSLMGLGSSLLSALEKKDVEALTRLHNTQEATLLNLTTFIKEQQVEELVVMKKSLNESLNSATERNTHYTQLLDQGLSPAEIVNIVGMTAAMVFNTAAGVTKTLSAIGYAVPQVGSPFAMTYGGQQIGAALNAASGALEIGSIVSNFVAQLSLTIAGYQRRAEEWELQAALSKYDMAQISYQIDANEINQAIRERELENHKVSIQQNKETETFLRTKFTNEELYQWMVTRISNVYFQTYSIAYELALSAQRAYQFELSSDHSFINYGYWDDLHKGLLSGESLMLSLNQMEKSYLDNSNRPLEIEKTISLLQINPLAVIELIQTGSCTFELSEKLFDDDFPGHFNRKIKTISISIPVVVGPYQNLNATLTQLSNHIITKANVNAVDYLLGGTSAKVPEATEMRSNWLVNQHIAISKGVSDSGLFELNFNDDRYLPFEGTGAISSWKLSLPKATNQIDFDQISDVIIQLKYTASDGGSKFKQDVTKLPALKNDYGSRFFTMATMFASEWYAFLQNPKSTTTQTLNFKLGNLSPTHVISPFMTGFYMKLTTLEGINLTGSGNYIQLVLPNNATIDFNLNTDGSYLHTFNAKYLLESLEGNCQLNFNLANAPKDIIDQKKFLNPELIKNIELIFFYQGEIIWSAS